MCYVVKKSPLLELLTVVTAPVSSSFTVSIKGTTEQNCQTVQTVTAGRGHDVTLPCKNVIQGQHNCNSTTWIFSDSNSSVELFELGQNKEAKPKSDRLSLSADCSLVIKKVTDQDVGRYNCRQFKTATGSQEGSDFMIDLSVINSEDVKTTKSATSLTLTTASNNPSADSGIDSEMTTSTTVKSTTRKSMTAEPRIKPTLKITNICTTKEEVKTSEGTLTTASNKHEHDDFLYLLRCIIVSVGLAALLISAVTVNMWTKTKGNKTQTEENTVSLNTQ
ncbi:uncharacterized protein LOC112842453 [Oreochromis niloticus]|uniref:uncharacterized protein LOC112842453 n=1 Tax=Oreochromis niloticus TaxID=8128 RepID=UPI000DF42394|nr:uncharacterized protein LOC112842453 [Oreochromis niloticus]